MIIAKIQTSDIEAVKERVTKLNRRAKKLGLSPMILEIGEKYQQEEDICIDSFLGIYKKVVRVYHDVTLHGEVPVIPGGWQLVGVIEHNPINIIKTVPGEEIPEIYRNRTVCDHCHVNRFRNKTIIVKNETGEYIQVGTTCVKDFLGINPASLLYFFELNDKDLEDKDGGCVGYVELYHLEDFLTKTAGIIKTYGWLSKGKAQVEGGQSTADAVLDYYNAKSTSGEKMRKDVEITDTEKELVVKAIQWVKDNTDNSDYIFNLKQIVEFGAVPIKSVGFAASIIPAYIKTTIEQKEEKVSNWQGEIGKKIKVEVTFIGEFSFESYYGITYVKKFVDVNGNVFVWFTTSHNGFEVDKTYTIQGTVKKHDDYNGKLQTVITRVKKC